MDTKKIIHADEYGSFVYENGIMTIYSKTHPITETLIKGEKLPEDIGCFNFDPKTIKFVSIDLNKLK